MDIVTDYRENSFGRSPYIYLQPFTEQAKSCQRHKSPQTHFVLLNHYTCPIPVLGKHIIMTFSHLANKTAKKCLSYSCDGKRSK